MSDTRRRFKLVSGALLTTTIATAALLMPTATQAIALPGTLSGDFRNVCDYSHTLADDPIVQPNQPGASHLHDFFGNTTTDADSTHESLRSGGSTCNRRQDTAAYWVPALFQDGKKIRPRHLAAYYRGGQKSAGTIRAFPANLRVIAGDAHHDELDPAVAAWTCQPGGLFNPTAGCPIGTDVQLAIRFPDCWDGKRLDSADHKSHMAYARATAGPRVCPASHPVPVPVLELQIAYPGARGGPGWSLASGSPGSAHADFFNAWNQDTLENLVTLCIKSGMGRADGLVC